ncbi:DUF2716 domain-containing protein [Paenibacillus sp. GCM10023252]|uniref:DUF2716 domain-containing protein n=1 Tax=Paenibacillus sp. GCM10023252 TaxID=3252649 RepID=UPI0036083358
MNNWITLNDNEDLSAWDMFEKKFNFKPSIKSSEWPSIQVKSDNYISYELLVTWDMIGDFEELCNNVFKTLTNEEEYIYALDWQHECFWFNPHLPRGDQDWIIPFYPDGDYYIFFPRDLRWCYFSHPWERSVTLIGEDLISKFESNKPDIFGRVIRGSK